MPRDEDLRFFVDETTLGVGRALAMVRGDVVHPGHRRLPGVPAGALDTEWMPIVADLGLVVISRDRHIKSKAAELAAFHAAGLRAFWIAGDKDLGNWENLTRLVRWFERIERIIAAKGPGPWMYALNLTSVTELFVPSPRPPRPRSNLSAQPRSAAKPRQLNLDLGF